MADVSLTVSAAVLRDLEALPDGVVNTTDAAIAMALATKLDRGGEISVAPVAKELAAVMDRLRAAAQGQSTGDGVDDLAAARAARRAGASAG